MFFDSAQETDLVKGITCKTLFGAQDFLSVVLETIDSLMVDKIYTSYRTVPSGI